MATNEITLERTGKVATLTLNRPDARNSFTDAMVDGIQDALAELDRDDSVHVLVTTGAGSSYSAGGDLKAMKDRAGMFSGGAADLKQAYERGLQRNTRAFDTFTKPVVAKAGRRQNRPSSTPAVVNAGRRQSRSSSKPVVVKAGRR